MGEKIFYKASCLKFTEEDDFEKGCLPETSRDIPIEEEFFKPTLGELVKAIEDFTQGKAHAFEGEGNRIEVQVMEDVNGIKATPHEEELWKQGRRKLYLSNYSFYVRKLKECDEVSDEIKNLKLPNV